MSRIDSFFIENNENIIKGDEFHHLSKVLRKKTGDKVRLLNGKGEISWGEIYKIERERAYVKVLEKKIYKKKFPSLNFFISFVPREKRNLIVQKLTELGVSSINFFPSKYSKVAYIKKEKEKKLVKVSIGAIKQSGNPFLPKIKFLNSFDEILKLKGKNIFLSQEGNFLIKFNMKEDFFKQINILVGPEGGFSDEEIKSIRENGFEEMKISENILRTETAAISSAAIISYLTEVKCF